MEDLNILIVFLIMHCSSKILFNDSKNTILNCSQSIIKVYLIKIKILVFQLIHKFSVDLILVNILIFLALVLDFYIVLVFYKADISRSIAYKNAAIEYSFVTDIFIEVHIIIWYKKSTSLCFLKNLFYNNLYIGL